MIQVSRGVGPRKPRRDSPVAAPVSLLDAPVSALGTGPGVVFGPG